MFLRRKYLPRQSNVTIGSRRFQVTTYYPWFYSNTQFPIEHAHFHAQPKRRTDTWSRRKIHHCKHLIRIEQVSNDPSPPPCKFLIQPLEFNERTVQSHLRQHFGWPQPSPGRYYIDTTPRSDKPPIKWLP